MQGAFLEELEVGQTAELKRTVAAGDLAAFAAVTGDNNPIHLDEAYAATTPFNGRIAHGMLSAGYISAVLGTKLPGPGAVYVSQTLSFRRPVRIGDEVTAEAKVAAIDAARGRVTFKTRCVVAGKTVVEGEAVVSVPQASGLMALRVFHHYRDLGPEARGAAVAFGTFDGVHLGHQEVIRQAAEAAYELGAPLGVVSLEPHPNRLFFPDSPPFQIMNQHQFARAVAELAAERLYLLPFGQQMASLSDRKFVEDILVRGLGVRHVAVGFDVTFGFGRTGNPEAMRRYGEEFGFTVSVAGEVDGTDGAKVSSTAIRKAIHDGDPELAARLLSRPFAIEGLVVKGQQLGRKLGIPTANVPLGEYVTPKLGVYATRTRLKDGRHLPGVANIGMNPTTGLVEARLEVWLFDFDEDIYGEVIETELIAFLRPEVTFRDAAGKFDVPGMVAQIHRDAAEARSILGA